MIPDVETLSADKGRRILAGASIVFGHDGYEGASMSRIANEAGVSKGTLYNYFDSKADLFTALVRGICDRDLGLAFGDVDTAAPADVLLRQIGHRFLDLVLSESGLVLYRMVVGEAEHFPALAATYFENGPGAARHWLSGWLGERVTRGELEIEDTEFAADQFFALIQTALVAPRRMRLGGRATAEEQDRVVDGAVDMFLAFYGRQR